jgi:hypothetical protein
LQAPDTLSLSSRINSKLNITDTIGKWYLQSTRFQDTMYRVNDSTIGYTIKGAAHTIQILGRSQGGGGGSGTVTSVGLSMPSAFSVSGSPITSAGTISVSGNGTALQYIRGNGTLATFDTTAIPNFYIKARSLLSGTSPITYNTTTGAIGISNASASGTKGAATFSSSDFSDNGSGTISLANVGSAGNCINCQLSLDAKGRVTSYANGTPPTINNAMGAGDTLAITDSVKRLNPGYGILHAVTASNITQSVDTSEIATQYDLTQLSQTTLSNIGSGFRWVATPSGNIKTAYGNNTITIDSSSNSNALTIKADTSYLATKYDVSLKLNKTDTTNKWVNNIRRLPGSINVEIFKNGVWSTVYQDSVGTGGGSTALTYKNVGFGSLGNMLSTGEAAFQYDSMTNKLYVDSAELKQARGDSVFLRRLSPYLAIDTLVADGNSITVGLNASPMTDSGYVYRLKSQLGVAINNIAVSGTGMVSIANRHLINVNPGMSVMTTVMGWLNDGRRNGAARVTINKGINGFKSIFANQYMKSYTNAGTGGVGVTRYGSWANSWNAQAEGGKTTAGAYTSTANDSIVYVFTDSTVIVGLMGGDGSGGSYVGTDIDVYIDGTLNSTINTNNQTDGISDGSGLDNKRCAMAFYFGSLSYASHSIKLVKKSTGGGGFMICDYFAHFIARSDAQLMLWFHAPYLTAAGYATSPANANNSVIDSINNKIDSLVNSSFIKWYPTYRVQTNSCYDTTTGTSGDGIHPNNAGHRQIFNCAMNTINSVNGSGGSTGKFYYTNAFHGVVEGQDDIFLMLSKGDIRYIQNQTATTQTADYKISGTATANKYVTGGTTLGGSITQNDNYFTAGLSTVGSNPFFALHRADASTDQKNYDWLVGTGNIGYRLLSDDMLSATNYMTVFRSGATPTRILFPLIEVTATSALIGEIHSGTSTDYGAFQFQNTGSFYQTGGNVYLNGLTPPPSSYNLLVHGLTDSITYQVPLSVSNLLEIQSGNIQFNDAYMTSLPNNHIFLKSRMERLSFTASDANFTTLSTRQEGLFELPDITTNRTFDMFTGSAVDGVEFYVYNGNTTGNTWSFSGNTPQKASNGASVTTMTNGVLYHLLGVYVNSTAIWIIVNQ